MTKFAISVILIAAAITAATTASATAAGCGTVCLKAKVAVLAAKNTRLEKANFDLGIKLDTAEAKLTVAQSKLDVAAASLPAFVATLDPFVIWSNVIPGLAAKFNGGKFQTDRYQSGTDWISYTFTYCGFC